MTDHNEQENYAQGDIMNNFKQSTEQPGEQVLMRQFAAEAVSSVPVATGWNRRA